MKKINSNSLFNTHKLILITVLMLLVVSCGKSKRLKQLEIELLSSSQEVYSLINKAKAGEIEVDSSLEKYLEIYTLLLVSYFSEGGDIDVDMTAKNIHALEFYREHSDYLNTPPVFQSYLPLVYGLQAGLYGSSDRILATENAKKSIREFEDLIEIYPEDLIINVYYATILGNLPKIFKARRKALDKYIWIDDYIQKNQLEEKIPPKLKILIYSKASELSRELLPNTPKYEYFREKIELLNNQIKEK